MAGETCGGELGTAILRSSASSLARLCAPAAIPSACQPRPCTPCGMGMIGSASTIAALHGLVALAFHISGAPPAPLPATLSLHVRVLQQHHSAAARRAAAAAAAAAMHRRLRPVPHTKHQLLPQQGGPSQAPRLQLHQRRLRERLWHKAVARGGRRAVASPGAAPSACYSRREAARMHLT